MYGLELDMVERRWVRKERFDFILKREISHDIKIIVCLIILTAAIPKVEFLAIVIQMSTLLIAVGFAKWLIKR